MHTKPTFIYVYSQFGYGGERRSKVGISVNHKNRYFGHYGFGHFSFVKQYEMPSRKAAFALEALVCQTFPAFYKREFLDVSAEEVCQFIESRLTKSEAA